MSRRGGLGYRPSDDQRNNNDDDNNNNSGYSSSSYSPNENHHHYNSSSYNNNNDYNPNSSYDDNDAAAPSYHHHHHQQSNYHSSSYDNNNNNDHQHSYHYQQQQQHYDDDHHSRNDQHHHQPHDRNENNDDEEEEEEEQLYDKEFIGDLFDESKDVEYANTEVNSSTPLPNLRSMATQNALKMMKNMGWDAGVGLGANNQGRTTHIEPAQVSGRSGLGMRSVVAPTMVHASSSNNSGGVGTNVVVASNRKPLPPNFTVQKHEVDTRVYPHQQYATWLSCMNPISSDSDPTTLYKMYYQESFEEPYSKLFDQRLLQRVMNMKNEFDPLDDLVFSQARSKANPYEFIGKSIFQNRAAVKMANLDKIAALTHIDLLPEENGILYFADICAGPGGFTEYMYWRLKPTRTKGWGFTLRGKHDWQLQKFNAEAPCTNFETCYGVDDTGDITNNDNMKNLAERIEKGTGGRGIPLLLADGGFGVEGNYNNQEALTKQIVLCQFLTALLVLRPGGTFVCKVFDVYTHFSVSLLYMLYQSFERFSIVKPFTSRPANSERYVICKGFRGRNSRLTSFLFNVNSSLSQKKDVSAILHPDIITNDSAFANYMTKSNDDIMKEQLQALRAIKQYVEDEYLSIKPMQLQLQERCLEEWGLPRKLNTTSSRGRGGGSMGRGNYHHRHSSGYDSGRHHRDHRDSNHSYSSHGQYNSYNPQYDNSSYGGSRPSYGSGGGGHDSYYPSNNYYEQNNQYAPDYDHNGGGGSGGWDDERPNKRQRE